MCTREQQYICSSKYVSPLKVTHILLSYTNQASIFYRRGYSIRFLHQRFFSILTATVQVKLQFTPYLRKVSLFFLDIHFIDTIQTYGQVKSIRQTDIHFIDIKLTSFRHNVGTLYSHEKHLSLEVSALLLSIQ